MRLIVWFIMDRIWCRVVYNRDLGWVDWKTLPSFRAFNFRSLGNWSADLNTGHNRDYELGLSHHFINTVPLIESHSNHSSELHTSHSRSIRGFSPRNHKSLVCKEMQLAYHMDVVMRDIIPRLEHGHDGLIFTCAESGYIMGTDENMWVHFSPTFPSLLFFIPSSSSPFSFDDLGN